MALVTTFRDFPPGMKVSDIEMEVRENSGCMSNWNMQWQYSIREPAGTRMLCFFEAPDAESVRMAIRQAGWQGEAIVKTMNHYQADDQACGAIVVERHFEEPVIFEDLQATENEHARCLDRYRVKFIESYFSLDRKTMVCLYQAPDAESVRSAQRQASMPFTRVWASEKVDYSSFT